MTPWLRVQSNLNMWRVENTRGKLRGSFQAAFLARAATHSEIRETTWSMSQGPPASDKASALRSAPSSRAATTAKISYEPMSSETEPTQSESSKS